MMHTEKLTLAVREELAKLTSTSPDDWFLVFRARLGMESVLAAVAAVKGAGEVITQPFTCATALNPILSAGHIPIYTDTSESDLSLDTTHVQASASTRALIMQHSFGIESNMKKARTFANKHGLLLLEDSAHQLGMMSRKDDRVLADVSVHSFGVEKMLPTKFGGAIWVNPEMKDTALREAIIQALTRLPVVSRQARGRAKRYRFFNRLLNHTPSFLASTAKNIFVNTGLFQPAIMPIELAGRNYDQPSRPNSWVLKHMLSGLQNYAPLLEQRRRATTVFLGDFPKNLTLPKSIPDNYAPARLPVLCENKLEAERLFTALRSSGHYSGKWYRPTIFPGALNTATYNYDPEQCPVAEDIATRILNLPTNITASEAKEILDVLHRETD